MINVRLAGSAAMVSVSALLLTGCAGSSASIYEFQSVPPKPAASVSVELPSALREAAGITDEDSLVERYQISGRKLETSEYCAFDVRLEFSPGGERALSAPSDFLLISTEEKTPAKYVAARLNIDGMAIVTTDLDSSDPKAAVYVSDEPGKITVVDRCASSVYEPTSQFSVMAADQGSGELELFATVLVAPMADGTVGISGEVEHFELDSNGDWIAG